MPSSIRSSRSRSLSRLTAFFGRSESRNRDNDTDRQTHSPDDTLNVPQVRERSPGNRLTKRDRSQSNHRLPAVFRSSSRSSSTTAPSAWPPKNYSQEEQVGWRPPSLHNSDASGSRPGSVRSDRGESRGPSRANSVAKALAPPSSFVPPDETKSRRKSWMFGGSRRKTSGSEQVKARAWIAGHPDGRVPYDLGPLLNAGRVPELWNSSGGASFFRSYSSSHSNNHDRHACVSLPSNYRSWTIFQNPLFSLRLITWADPTRLR